MAKISAQAVKSRKDTEDFFRTVGMGVGNKAKLLELPLQWVLLGSMMLKCRQRY